MGYPSTIFSGMWECRKATRRPHFHVGYVILSSAAADSGTRRFYWSIPTIEMVGLDMAALRASSWGRLTHPNLFPSQLL